MSAAGSAIAQHAIEGRTLSEHELYRTQRLAVYGALIFAPIANRWHALLNLINLRSKVGSESLDFRFSNWCDSTQAYDENIDSLLPILADTQ